MKLLEQYSYCSGVYFVSKHDMYINYSTEEVQSVPYVWYDMSIHLLLDNMPGYG